MNITPDLIWKSSFTFVATSYWDISHQKWAKLFLSQICKAAYNLRGPVANLLRYVSKLFQAVRHCWIHFFSLAVRENKQMFHVWTRSLRSQCPLLLPKLDLQILPSLKAAPCIGVYIIVGESIVWKGTQNLKMRLCHHHQNPMIMITGHRETVLFSFSSGTRQSIHDFLDAKVILGFLACSIKHNVPRQHIFHCLLAKRLTKDRWAWCGMNQLRIKGTIFSSEILGGFKFVRDVATAAQEQFFLHSLSKPWAHAAFMPLVVLQKFDRFRLRKWTNIPFPTTFHITKCFRERKLEQHWFLPFVGMFAATKCFYIYVIFRLLGKALCSVSLSTEQKTQCHGKDNKTVASKELEAVFWFTFLSTVFVSWKVHFASKGVSPANGICGK